MEKKSRFIADLCPVTSEEEALDFIEEIRKKYWDARHNCYAYIIGDRGQTARCSDDGGAVPDSRKTHDGCAGRGGAPRCVPL